MRLVDAEFTLSPPGEMHWMHDVFGNSVALVEFAQAASELRIVSTLQLERYGLEAAGVPDRPGSANVSLRLFVATTAATSAGCSSAIIPIRAAWWRRWAKGFTRQQPLPTYNLLSNINGAIRSEFAYNKRYAEGTQTPIETLEKKSGTCRDFALLFIEAARYLGFGAVSSPAICTIRRSTAGKPCKAPAPPTPGRMSICRAPAGSNTTRPTG